MTNIALIPCRGGSKGVPRKNLQQIHGVPLVIRSIYTCLGAGISDVFVSTDDETISSYAIAAGAKVLVRPDDLSQDHTSTEDVLNHSIENLVNMGFQGSDNVLLLQATSPFTRSETLKLAINTLTQNPQIGVFASQEWHGFIWYRENAYASPNQHDPAKRIRRQDMLAQVLETGNLYGATISSYLKSKIRFVEPLLPLIVGRKEALEIDSYDDLDFCNNVQDFNFLVPQKKVRVVFTDFDGVLTDNRVIQLDSGELGASINRSDGIAVGNFGLIDVPVVIVTSELGGPAFGRAKKLGIECVHAEDKLLYIVNYCNSKSINLSEVAFVGNDVNDLGPISTCGWSFVPNDAHSIVAKYADRILSSKGGDGVLREVFEILFP
jgi:YrbI family 3-deoxy-D-manno-octulosonate 8-phosphate phosphatase